MYNNTVKISGITLDRVKEGYSKASNKKWFSFSIRVKDEDIVKRQVFYYFNCMATGEIAEKLSRTYKKDVEVKIEGKITLFRKQDGSKVYGVSIIVREIIGL